MAKALDGYEAFLGSQTLHTSPLRAIMREVDVDAMAGMSTKAISNRESTMLRTREKASVFCSLLTAYRLLDVIAMLEENENSVRPPSQSKMTVDFSKHAVGVFIKIRFAVFFYFYIFYS